MMEDMIHGDRSIRNIPVSQNHRSPISGKPGGLPPAGRVRKTRSNRRLWLGVIVVLLCAAAGILLSTLFEKTTVTLYPHQATVTVTKPIMAEPVAAGGGLLYQTFSVTRSASTTGAITGTQHVSKQATGVATIYNTYSTASQKLLANTRFTAPDGKIYRIHSVIIVPGATKNSDGSLKAGSITSTIYADQPGPTYNRTDATQFTIPGFKGDPRYTKFYAQTQGPISGGFVGDQPAIASAELSAATKNIKQTLDATVSTAANSSVPEGFVMVPGTLQISYSDIAQTLNADKTATLAQNATGRAVIVRLNDLASAIAKQGVSSYKGEPVSFLDTSTLSLSSGTTNQTNGTSPVAIIVSGSPTLVWKFDEQAIKQAIIGKQKSAFESIIRAFEPGVGRAEAKVRPFWKSTFPTEQEKIVVTTVLE